MIQKMPMSSGVGGGTLNPQYIGDTSVGKTNTFSGLIVGKHYFVLSYMYTSQSILEYDRCDITGSTGTETPIYIGRIRNRQSGTNNFVGSYYMIVPTATTVTLTVKGENALQDYIQLD